MLSYLYTIRKAVIFFHPTSVSNPNHLTNNPESWLHDIPYLRFSGNIEFHNRWMLEQEPRDLSRDLPCTDRREQFLLVSQPCPPACTKFIFVRINLSRREPFPGADATQGLSSNWSSKMYRQLALRTHRCSRYLRTSHCRLRAVQGSTNSWKIATSCDCVRIGGATKWVFISHTIGEKKRLPTVELAARSVRTGCTSAPRGVPIRQMQVHIKTFQNRYLYGQ